MRSSISKEDKRAQAHTPSLTRGHIDKGWVSFSHVPKDHWREIFGDKEEQGRSILDGQLQTTEENQEPQDKPEEQKEEAV